MLLLFQIFSLVYLVRVTFGTLCLVFKKKKIEANSILQFAVIKTYRVLSEVTVTDGLL